MISAWLVLALVLMLADWTAVWQGWERIVRITKPVVMLALLVWFVSTSGLGGTAFWFWLGLAASLVGDVLLLLPRSFFVYGLGAFLVALWAFAIGLNTPLPVPSVSLLIHFLLACMTWLMLVALMLPALRRNPTHRKLMLPVGIYAAAMCLMAFSALHTLWRPDWSRSAAVLAAFGGLLFFCSDALLACDRFIQPFPLARLWVRITYHLGQLGLAAGALMALTSG
jgi:uncharacterized membrane protein YhhN